MKTEIEKIIREKVHIKINVPKEESAINSKLELTGVEAAAEEIVEHFKTWIKENDGAYWDTTYTIRKSKLHDL